MEVKVTKTEPVLFTERSVEAMEAWFGTRRLLIQRKNPPNDDVDAVFLTNRVARISTRYVQKMMDVWPMMPSSRELSSDPPYTKTQLRNRSP